MIRRARIFAVRALGWLARRIQPDSGAISHHTASGTAWVPPQMPGWLRDELVALSSIEPELLPASGDVSKYAYYSVPQDDAPGIVYSNAITQLTLRQYTYIFVIPWLKPGGADKGILHHVKALRELHPAASILLISTEPSDSPWSDRIPSGVEFLELGLLFGGISDSDQMTVLSRLLVQLRPAATHVINSRIGWQCLKSNGLALSQSGQVFASLFCDEYNAAMTPIGYARDFLRDTHESASTIFCDNSHYPGVWTSEIGVPAEKFTLLPFPYDGETVDGARIPSLRKRVMWAGRLDRQKRLDVLIDIARQTPDIQYDVYGATVMATGTEEAVKLLSSLPNVTMHGPFSRIADHLHPEHFAFLMTTMWEGTPTMLLDICALGLPVVAPAVGGIPDIIDAEQLYSTSDAVDEAITLIRRFQVDGEFGRRCSDRQLSEIKSHRSWGEFTRRVASVPGYVKVQEVESAALR